MDSSSSGKENYFSKRKVRGSMLHYLTGRGIASVANFVVAILVVRELSVADYAAYTAITGLVLTLMALTNGGLDRVVARYIPGLCQENLASDLKWYCWVFLGLRMLLVIPFILIMFIFEDQLSAMLNVDFDRAILICMFWYILARAAWMQLQWTLQSMLLQKEITKATALEWFFKLVPIVGLMVATGSLDLFVVIFIQALSTFASAFYMLWRMVMHHQQLIKRNAENEIGEERLSLDHRQLARTAWWNYLQSNTGIHTSPSFAKLLSAAFYSTGATAALGFAFSLTVIIKRYLPANLLIGLIEPVVMARHNTHGDFEKTSLLVGIVLKVNMFILIPITVWFYLAGEPIVLMITGGKYADSVWMICLLMIVTMLESQRLVLQMLVNAIEQSQLLLYSNLQSLFAVPIAIPLMYFAGMPGLVVSIVVVALLRNYFLIRSLRNKGFDYKTDYGKGVQLVVVSIVSGLLAEALLLPFIHGLLLSACSAVIMAVIFLCCLYFWKVFHAEERDTLNRFIGKPLIIW